MLHTVKRIVVHTKCNPVQVLLLLLPPATRATATAAASIHGIKARGAQLQRGAKIISAAAAGFSRPVC
jgi:hypothetical protein